MGGPRSRTKEARASRKKIDGRANNPGGPEKYCTEKMIKEMEEWVKKESSINICGFCADYGYTYALFRSKVVNKQEFKDAYEIVRLRLAERRERLLNCDLLHSHAYNRYQSCYDPFIDTYEDEKKDQEAERKIKIAQAQPENTINLSEFLTDLAANPEKYIQE
jgi:hypothetical protein